MISTITDRIPSSLPKEYQPNPFVTDPIYAKWSEGVQPVNNVYGGATVWCKPDMLLSESTESLNQKLSGLANPKTLVQPIISMPIYDNDLWKSNDFLIPKGINDQRRQELSQNGYLIHDIPIHKSPKNTEIYEGFEMRDERRCMRSSDLTNESMIPNNSNPSVWNSNQSEWNTNQNVWNSNRNNLQQPFLTEFGYTPDNIEYNIPTNKPTGECELRPEMKKYNENIYTSTIQPGVYVTSQINQPDSSQENLGISFTQPFLPTYSSYVERKNALDYDKNGVLYTQYDPNFAPQYECAKIKAGITEDTIYDPRFTGYGTGYRGYVDELTGQPRYYYDDVDVQRRNKFITRNALDFLPFGLQNGPQDPERFTNMEIREMAQNSYLDNQISYRTELQQRLMQKNNNREWQQKKSPIIRNQFNRGASSGAHGVAPSGYAGPRG